MRKLLLVIALVACTQAPPAATATPTAAPPTATPSVTASPFPAVTGAAPTFTPGQPTPPPTAAPTTSAPTAAPTPAAACPIQRGGDQSALRAPRTIRAAGHPEVRHAIVPDQAGYDRVVVDFGPGSIPTFAIEQVPRIVQGGSGFPIEMQGSVFIRVHWPAAGGSGEYAGPRRLLPDTDIVREVVFTEFEGATTVGIGLLRLVCPTMSILPGGRLVLDFFH